MTIGRALLLLSAAAVSLAASAKPASAFLATSSSSSSSSMSSPSSMSSMSHHPRGGIAFAPKMAAESEVSFSDDLDGSSIRIGVLRTRWNDVHVSNLVEGIKVSLVLV
jgi:6,7-dimethyl-8-ribityllumazine synthase